MPWKSRSLTRNVGTTDICDTRFGNKVHTISHVSAFGTQATYSESHEWPGATLTNGNVGGPFYTDKVWSDPAGGFIAGGNGLKARSWFQITSPTFLGMLGYGDTILNGMTYGPSSTETLRDMAGPVVKGMSPTASEAGLAQAMGELRRDGLPRLIGADTLETRAHDFRSLGNEHLNIQFGWLPFVSDVHDLAHAVKDSHRILNQFRRDSGRVIRRRANLPSDETSIEAAEGTMYAYPLVADAWNIITRPVKSTLSIRRKRWVSAAYSYYLDPGDSLIGKFARYNQEADKLLGVSLNPDVLWELAPWSWAVDWFADVGTSVSTLGDFINFGPALRYAYVMETTTSKREYTGTGFEDGNAVKHDLSFTYNRVAKVRDPVSPFVFRHVDGDLTLRQQAIVAALGISHAPGAIRP